MRARDPIIAFDDYFDEAKAALDCLWPIGSPKSRLIYGVILRVMDDFSGDAIHQSALDQLLEDFAKAVDEAESEMPSHQPAS
jgi:hypothetical protein